MLYMIVSNWQLMVSCHRTGTLALSSPGICAGRALAVLAAVSVNLHESNDAGDLSLLILHPAKFAGCHIISLLQLPLLQGFDLAYRHVFEFGHLLLFQGFDLIKSHIAELIRSNAVHKQEEWGFAESLSSKAHSSVVSAAHTGMVTRPVLALIAAKRTRNIHARMGTFRLPQLFQFAKGHIVHLRFSQIICGKATSTLLCHALILRHGEGRGHQDTNHGQCDKYNF